MTHTEARQLLAQLNDKRPADHEHVVSKYLDHNTTLLAELLPASIGEDDCVVNDDHAVCLAEDAFYVITLATTEYDEAAQSPMPIVTVERVGLDQPVVVSIVDQPVFVSQHEGLTGRIAWTTRTWTFTFPDRRQKVEIQTQRGWDHGFYNEPNVDRLAAFIRSHGWPMPDRP